MKSRILKLHSIGLGLALAAGATAFGKDDVSTPPKPVKPSPTSTLTKPQPGPGKAETADSPTTQQPANPVHAPAPLSPWSAQVLKLAQAHINEDVVFSYIDSAGTFNLTTEQIISLTQAGVSKDIITAMLQHDADIFAGVKEVTASTVPALDLGIPPLPPNVQAGSVVAKTQAGTAAQQPADFISSSESMPDFVLEPFEDFYVPPPETLERSPVRKPYPVQLTAPIIVWRLP